MWPVNLLPDASTRRRQQLQTALPRLLLLAASLWLLLLAVGYAWAYWQLQTTLKLAEEREDAVQALEAIARQVLEVQQLDARRRELQALIQQNSTPTLTPTLNLVTSLMPPAVTARQLSVEQGQFTLTCESTALEPIGQFYSNLQGSGQLTGVTLSALKRLERATSVVDGPGITPYYAFTVTFSQRGEKLP
jgi:Tfp pilus assembly protein PilN